MLSTMCQGWSKNFLRLLKIALPTIGLGACIGLIGDALNGNILLAQWSGVNEFSWGAWGKGLGVVILVTLAFAYWLYQKLPGELPLRNLSRPSRPEPHPVLIFLLSTPNPNCRIENNEIVFLSREGNEANRFQMTGDVSIDKEALRQLPRWNWQQQLHALALHRDCVEKIYLIGSSGVGGSQGHLDEFAKLVRSYRSNVDVIWDQGVDFEDIEAIYRRALKFVADAENTTRTGFSRNYRQEEIMIDATGGFKTASIAAGLVTLHNRVKFQYVNNSGEVVAYEMVYEPTRSMS